MIATAASSTNDNLSFHKNPHRHTYPGRGTQHGSSVNSAGIGSEATQAPCQGPRQARQDHQHHCCGTPSCDSARQWHCIASSSSTIPIARAPGVFHLAARRHTVPPVHHHRHSIQAKLWNMYVMQPVIPPLHTLAHSRGRAHMGASYSIEPPTGCLTTTPPHTSAGAHTLTPRTCSPGAPATCTATAGVCRRTDGRVAGRVAGPGRATRSAATR